MTAMIDWLPGVRRVPWDRDGGSMVETDYGVTTKWRFVFHTTQTKPGSFEAVMRNYAGRHWPHLTADLTGSNRLIAQHGPFNRAATTMDNDPGGVQVNRAKAVQIEMVGEADLIRAQTSKEGFFWLGAQVAPIFMPGLVLPISTTRPWVDQTDGFVAREGAFQRMTFEEWARFNGICGHQHGPEDEHYDPGKIDIYLPSFILGIRSTLNFVTNPSTQESPVANRVQYPVQPTTPQGRSHWPHVVLQQAGQDFLLGLHGARLNGSINTAFGWKRTLAKPAVEVLPNADRGVIVFYADATTEVIPWDTLVQIA